MPTKFCVNCGAEIDERAVICPKCGLEQPGMSKSSQDTGSVGWIILGFLIPIVGLILYLVWKDDKPISAKQAGQGALASVILGIALWIVIMIIGFGALATS